MNKKLWKIAREEARDKIVKDTELKILGTDMDKDVLSLARYHAKRGGVFDHIHFQQMQLSEFSSNRKYGIIICNPPYGERLENEKKVKALYKEMGRVFRPLDTWSFYILTPLRGFERYFGRRWDRDRKLYNGKIECHYYQFYGPRPPKKRDGSSLDESS